MAQAINSNMDEELKKSMEKGVLFDASVDLFYSESNIAYLKKVVEDIENGKAVLAEHELIGE